MISATSTPPVTTYLIAGCRTRATRPPIWDSSIDVLPPTTGDETTPAPAAGAAPKLAERRAPEAEAATGTGTKSSPSRPLFVLGSGRADEPFEAVLPGRGRLTDRSASA